MATILENVQKLSVHLEDAYTALEGKGATIPQQKNATNLSATVASLPAAGFTIDDLLTTSAEPLKDIVINVTEIPAGNNGGNNSNHGGIVQLFRSRPNFVRSVDFPNLQKIGEGGCTTAFYGQSNLQEVKRFSPTQLEPYACEGMFTNCTSLSAFHGTFSSTKVPAYGYSRMFNGCTNLKNIPSALPATDLSSYCYQFMFNNCKALTTVPTLPPLPVTVGAGLCYAMFQGCKGINNRTISLKILPGPSVPWGLVYNMFKDCGRNLKAVLDFTDFTQVPQITDTNVVNILGTINDPRVDILVPAALEASWKTSSNWSAWANRIIGV